ncbi:MAG: hypothetical protein K6G42_10310 [Lachnospiraceae bacterium]|nr:hypothetical protein [Lachnospiraceae bacterium]
MIRNKTIGICFILVLCVFLTACGGEKTDESQSGQSQTDQSQNDGSQTNSSGSGDILTDFQQSRQQLRETVEGAKALIGNSEDNGYTGKYLSGYQATDEQAGGEAASTEQSSSESPSQSTGSAPSSQSAGSPKQSGTSSTTSSTADQNNKNTSKQKTSSDSSIDTGKYTPVGVSQLYSELEENAMRAEENWNDKYVAITGYLSSVDNDGKYFSITGSNESWDFVSVHCSMKDNDQVKSFISTQNKGDELVVYGKISEIGEVIGYTVDVDVVEGYVSNNNTNNTAKASNGKYSTVTVGDLCSALDNNAMRAESEWKDQYVQITGYFYSIDSDGKYFSISNGPEESSILDGTIHCSMGQDGTVKNTVINKNKGDKMVVSGKITTVGEIMGISVDVETVE